jgi:hypothetical protein
MALLELLVAIAVVGLITTAGFRAFASLGEILHRRNVSLVEAARVSGLETRLRRAWDHRIAHRFQSEPWLLIEGVPTGDADWLELRRLSLKTMGADGRVFWWELDGSAWGRIEVNAGAVGEWAPGTAPGLIHFRYPETRSPQNKFGLTLQGNSR